MADEQRTLTANFTADSSGFARGADEVVQKLKELNQDLEQNKAKVKELNATMREYQKELDRLNRETNNGENATQEQTARMQELRDSIAQCAVEIGTYQAAQGQLRSQISSANRELSDQREALDDTSKGFSAFSAAAIAAGGAAAAGLTLALTKAQELDVATGKLSASVGASAEQTAKYKDVITEVYSDNFGEDFYDIADSVAAVTKNLKELDEVQLEAVTEGALTLRDVFEYDVDETTRAAKALVTNFGISASEALDYIASGAQGGLDFSGELLDSISEYSVQFAKMGLGVSDMFAIMQAGADEGAWSLDKVGDAVKEMSVRVIDGSKGTTEGFTKAGLAADEMAAKFGQGGDVAYEAFIETIDALEAMTDPLERDAAGVALLGTMWEDLGADVVLSFNGIKDASYEATGAMEQMAGVAYDDTAASLERLRRELELSVVPVGEELLPMAQEFVNDIKPEIPEISETIQNVLGTVASLIKVVWECREAVVALGAGFLAFKATGAAYSGVSALKGAFNTLTKAIKDARTAQLALNTAQKASIFGAIAGVAAVAATAMWEYARSCGGAGDAAQEARDRFSELRSEQEQLTQSAEDYKQAAEGISDITKEYQEVKTTVTDTKEAEDRLYQIQNDLINQYGAQAEGIDLVNGKYSEQIALLNGIAEKNDQLARNEAKSAFITAEQAQSVGWNFSLSRDALDRDEEQALQAAYLSAVRKYYDIAQNEGGYIGDSDNLYISFRQGASYEARYNAISDMISTLEGIYGDGIDAKLYSELTAAQNEMYMAWQQLEAAEQQYRDYIYKNPSTTHSTAEYQQELGRQRLADAEAVSAKRRETAALSAEERKKQYDSEKQLADDMHSVGEISQQEYYNKLTELRDVYLDAQTHDWYTATKEIQSVYAQLTKDIGDATDDAAEKIKDGLSEISGAYKKLLNDIDRELEAHDRSLEDEEFQSKIDAVTARLKYEQLDEFSRRELEKELADLNADWGEVKYQRKAEDKRDMLEQVYTQSQGLMNSLPAGADPAAWSAAVNAAFGGMAEMVSTSNANLPLPTQTKVFNVTVQATGKTTAQVIDEIQRAIASGVV